MRDIAAQFREFARLDLARLNQGLSVIEHERWAKLKALLDRSLSGSPGAGARAGKDRRSASRVATRINCAYASGDDQREAVVSDLSTGGVFIRTHWPLQSAPRFDSPSSWKIRGVEFRSKGSWFPTMWMSTAARMCAEWESGSRELPRMSPSSSLRSTQRNSPGDRRSRLPRRGLPRPRKGPEEFVSNRVQVSCEPL